MKNLKIATKGGISQFIALLGSRQGLNGIIIVKTVAANPKIKIIPKPNQGEI